MKELALPVLAGIIAAAIEYPVAQKYETVPKTQIATRMLIAGAMAAASTYIALELKKQ